MTVEEAMDYCKRMETLRYYERYQVNKKAFEHAKEISALVSIARFGNAQAKREATVALSRF